MQNEQQSTGSQSGHARSRLLGTLMLVAGIVCAAFVLVHRINGNPWAKADTVLTAVAAILLLGCVVIWWDAITKALGSRGVMLQANATLVTLTVFGIIVCGNIIVERRLGHIKADLTAEKFYSLAPQTQTVVRSITKDNPVEILGFVPMDRYSDPRGRELQGKRLQEYDRLSDHLSVEVIDPLVHPEKAKIAKDAGLTTYPGCVVRFKNQPDRAEAVNSVDEADLTRGLIKLLDTSSRKVYFLKGHGELSMDKFENEGASKLKKMLEDDRYQVADLDLMTSSVPQDAACLLAIWPKYPYKAEELQKIETYLSGGGRLLACLDPDAQNNLGEVTAKYGIEFHGDVVRDSRNTWTGDATYYGSLDYGEHEAVRYHRMFNVPVLFIRSGYLTKGVTGDYEVTELIKSTASSYAESASAPATPPATPNQPAQPAASPTRVNGPLTIAMTATTKDPKDEDSENGENKDKKEEAAEATQPESKRIRVAVVADGEFAENLWGDYNPPNLEVASNLVAWLTDNSKVIGIRAKNPWDDLQKRKITIDQKGRKWLFVLTFLLPLVVIVGAGAAVQWVRRG